MVCVFFNDVTLHRVPAVQYSVYNTCTVHTQFTEPPASVTHCFLHFCSPTQFPLLKVQNSLGLNYALNPGHRVAGNQAVSYNTKAIKCYFNAVGVLLSRLSQSIQYSGLQEVHEVLGCYLSSLQ